MVIAPEPSRLRPRHLVMGSMVLAGVVVASLAIWNRFDTNEPTAAIDSAEPSSDLDDPPTGSALGVVRTTLAGTKAPMELIGLTGGEFTMGSPKGESGHLSDEAQHRVRVSAFEICKTEVSLAQYELVMKTKPNNCSSGCDAQHPVHNVSWFDAVKFLNKLTELENQSIEGVKLTHCYDETTGKWTRACTGYRLPTEAEWEYAARAGTTTAWSFGSQEKDICNYANVSTDVCKDGYEKLAPVETSKLKPNAWGLHAMHGNVWEWVFDVYAPAYDAQVADPVILDDGDSDTQNDERVIRGGAFYYRPVLTRSAFRVRDQPVSTGRYFGLRCARGAVP